MHCCAARRIDGGGATMVTVSCCSRQLWHAMPCHAHTSATAHVRTHTCAHAPWHLLASVRREAVRPDLCLQQGRRFRRPGMPKPALLYFGLRHASASACGIITRSLCGGAVLLGRNDVAQFLPRLSGFSAARCPRYHRCRRGATPLFSGRSSAAVGRRSHEALPEHQACSGLVDASHR